LFRYKLVEKTAGNGVRGIDVMIFKIFSPEKFSKKFGVFDSK
jgi:hypothetical protein